MEIFLSKANAEPEYETIEESELRDDDVVIEHIHEDAKTEEKENENGEKEIIEVSPAKEMVKIQKRPVALNDIHPLWTNIRMNAAKTNTKISTAKYLWITRNLCSGSI